MRTFASVTAMALGVAIMSTAGCATTDGPSVARSGANQSVAPGAEALHSGFMVKTPADAVIHINGLACPF